MAFSEKEQSTIGRLFRFFTNHPKAIVEVTFSANEPFLAKADGFYETDNGLETNEDGYEEFYAILLKRLDRGEYVELTYLHFPKCITYNGEFVAGTAEDFSKGEQ